MARYQCRSKELRRVRDLEKTLDAVATSPFARAVNAWALIGVSLEHLQAVIALHFSMIAQDWTRAVAWLPLCCTSAGAERLASCAFPFRCRCGWSI